MNPYQKIKCQSTKLTFALSLTGLVVTAMGETSSPEESTSGEVFQLEGLTVVGTEQARYVVDAPDALTGIDLNFLDNPRSISILPEQLILDRKITDLNEALRNVPSVTFGDGFGGTNDDFYIRGFRRNSIYRNGFRRNTNFRTNLTNIEYTQVVRGPAAITYGQVEPGGIVDVVTKKPLAVQRLSSELRYGSYNDFLALVDWSQPINEDIAFRVVASTQDAESFRDFTEIERDSVALSARINLSDSTRIELGYEYRDESRPLDRGSLAVPTSDGFVIVNELLDVPFSQRFGDPFEESETEFDFSEVTLIHDFNDIWSAKLSVAYESSLANDLQSRPRSIFVANADDPINDQGFFTGVVDPSILLTQVYDDPTDRVFLAKRLDGSRGRDTETSYANLLVNGELVTGEITHRIAFGADFHDAETKRQFVVGEESNGTSIPFFNIEEPVYDLPGTYSLDGVPFQFSEGQDYGFFLNSYTEFTERTGLLLGIRYSSTEGTSGVEGFGTVFAQGSDGWVPQIGLSHQVADNFSLFASYSESFSPNQADFDSTGNVLEVYDPELGEQIEIGTKAEFFNGGLQASAVLYQIDLTNVIAGQNIDGSPIFVDGQTADGFELSVTGQPIPGMNITAAYSYIDAELSTGNQVGVIPDYSFNVYASYEWQEGALEGLGMGGGVFHESDRFNDAGNTITLDEYTLVDASIWYTIEAPQFLKAGNERGTIRFQLAFKNLFDERYYGGSSGNQLRIPLGTPRTTVGSISWEF
ncbi:TonB-dependent siderophore receptor [Puniceicoccaceae bacterium K14]|nr:TonB-dependent siderophore receptor [Puniceicoccaceae bacterium K14]